MPCLHKTAACCQQLAKVRWLLPATPGGCALQRQHYCWCGASISLRWILVDSLQLPAEVCSTMLQKAVVCCERLIMRHAINYFRSPALCPIYLQHIFQTRLPTQVIWTVLRLQLWPPAVAALLRQLW